SRFWQNARTMVARVRSALLFAAVFGAAVLPGCTPDSAIAVGTQSLYGACFHDQDCAPGLFCGDDLGCQPSYGPGVLTVSNPCHSSLNCAPSYFCASHGNCQPTLV